jgi:polyhydroxyalkanoate synthesis regulator phasin
MSSPKPLWRNVFDLVEKGVAPKLESMVGMSEFADLISVLTKLRYEANKRFEETTQNLLHMWNFPAVTDLKKLSEQVSSLERRIHELSKVIEDLKENQAE